MMRHRWIPRPAGPGYFRRPRGELAGAAAVEAFLLPQRYSRPKSLNAEQLRRLLALGATFVVLAGGQRAGDSGIDYKNFGARRQC